MSGPIISWSPISDSYNASAQYVNDGRYKLLSPSSIVGTPTLALQNAFQACTVKTYLGSPSVLNTTLTVPVSGTKTILHSSGRALTVAELQTLVIEAEGVELNETLFTTDEPNGSPSAPFATEAERTAWATANPPSPHQEVWAGGKQYEWDDGFIDSITPTRIDGELTIGTLGDSTGTLITESVPGTVFATDQQAISAAIPGSGTTYVSINPAVAGITWLANGYRFIADGGIPGEATSAILARTAATYAANRRALYDVAKIRPRVLLLIGGLSINDLQSLPDESDYTTADQMIANAKQIIKLSALSFEKVVYTTFLGFNNPSFTTSRNNMIRTMMTYATAALKTFCQTLGNVGFVDLRGVTCNDDFTWKTGMYAAGSVHLHLSEKGGAELGQLLIKKLSRVYLPKTSSQQLYDFQKDWANPSSGRPAGVTVAAYGSATGITSVTAAGVYTVAFAAGAATDGVTVTISGLKNGALSGLVTGQSFFLEHDFAVKDSFGNLVDCEVETEAQLSNGGTLRVGNTFGLSKKPDQMGHVSTMRTKLPVDASALVSATAVIRFAPRAVGNYTVDLYPPRIMLG